MHSRTSFSAFVTICLTAISGCATDVTKNNHAVAQFQKGDCNAALAELLPLAEHQFAAAQNNMGLIYDAGCPKGEPNYPRAFHWFAQAASNDVPAAMCNLAWYFEHGLGVKRDEALAREWYVSAARWGNQPAKRRLEALGVPAPSSDLLEQAQAEKDAKHQEMFDDVVAVVLGATLGIVASHSHTSPSNTTAVTAPQAAQKEPSTTYRGAFTGSSSHPAMGQPGTFSVLNSGNSTYVTRTDGSTTEVIEHVGNINNGRDPNSGRTWTETNVGNIWRGQDSNGLTWTRQQRGETMVWSYSDGTTKTCRVSSDTMYCD